MLANALRMKKVTLFSTGINRVHLINIIARALGVSLTRARRVVDFFTFQGSSHDGIWSRPLVMVETFVSLAHISILEINRFRLLHHSERPDCQLEGDGFELSVPDRKRVRSYLGGDTATEPPPTLRRTSEAADFRGGALPTEVAVRSISEGRLVRILPG
jgi:hypothetical protein